MEQHGRVIELTAGALERVSEETGEPLPEDAHKLAAARFAMLTGLQLERLTQPDLVDEGLSLRMLRIAMNEGGLDGLPDQAAPGRRARPPAEQGAA